jgi:heptaprenyl diphosphate synthase
MPFRDERLAGGPSLSERIRESRGNKRVFSISFLSTMAIALSIVESAVPRPLPWMRIGLANAMTLYALTVLTPREVLLVVLGRVVATSLLVGSFLSVTFLLGLSGALSSFVVMFAFHRWLGGIFSLVGISVIGALTSNFAQLMLVDALFIDSRVSFYFLPFIFLFALAGGTVSGFFGNFLVKNL